MTRPPAPLRTPIDVGTTADDSCFQAIARYVEAEALAAFAEEFEVRTAGAINEENILVRLWRIAAPNNVVRMTRNDDSGHARHADGRPLAGRTVNK